MNARKLPITRERTPGPWAQGRLISTSTTMRWTAEQRADCDAQERRMVFANFRASDEGRSRVCVAHCDSEADAAFIVHAANVHADLVAALEWAVARGRVGYSHRTSSNGAYCDEVDAVLATLAKAKEGPKA